jgi:hypothetical protein
VPGLKEVLEKLEYDPKKPIFFSQHRVPKGTLNYGQDDGDTTRLFAKYPNLVAFCGHAHLSASEEKSIWQGTFTCIQVPSLRYCTTLGGRENAYSILDRPPIHPYQMLPQHRGSGHTHQGMLCIVGTTGFSIRRWDFEEGKSLGPDWVMPLGKRDPHPFSKDELKKVIGEPQFRKGAKLTIVKGSASQRLCVKIPLADGNPDSRVYAYEIVVVGDEGAPKLHKAVYAAGCNMGIGHETNGGVTTLEIAKDELPPGKTLTFAVRPLTSLGTSGKAIATEFKV